MERLGVIDGPTRHIYFRELKEIVADCLRARSTRGFRRFFARWIREGAPIDPAVLYVPTPSLVIVLHQLCCTLPGMPGHLKADSYLWLTQPECRLKPGEKMQAGKIQPRPYDVSFIPYNIALYAPTGSHYEAFNKVGFVMYLADDPTPEEREATVDNVGRL